MIVAFAAETLTDPDARRERAERKRERKGVDLLVVNRADAEHGFENADNAVEIIGDGGAVVASAEGEKRSVSSAIWDAVVKLSQ
jgi:phosphopantothenoylcysteine decarboxylase/phosphopantothenate--cysteine ligase